MAESDRINTVFVLVFSQFLPGTVKRISSKSSRSCLIKVFRHNEGMKNKSDRIYRIDRIDRINISALPEEGQK